MKLKGIPKIDYCGFDHSNDAIVAELFFFFFFFFFFATVGTVFSGRVSNFNQSEFASD